MKKVCIVGSSLALALLPMTAQASTSSALVYHATLAGAFETADVNGVTIAVDVSSQSFRYSADALPDFDAIEVNITFTDDATGTLIEGLDGSAPGSASVGPALSSATILPTTVQIQDQFGGPDQATVTVAVSTVATGPANHTHFIARFCGPPKPCFGMFNIDATEQPGTATITLSGIVDGVDLSQVAFTPGGASMANLLGVNLLG